MNLELEDMHLQNRHHWKSPDSSKNGRTSPAQLFRLLPTTPGVMDDFFDLVCSTFVVVVPSESSSKSLVSGIEINLAVDSVESSNTRLSAFWDVTWWHLLGVGVIFRILSATFSGSTSLDEGYLCQCGLVGVSAMKSLLCWLLIWGNTVSSLC